jgi:hypothetical protein
MQYKNSLNCGKRLLVIILCIIVLIICKKSYSQNDELRYYSDQTTYKYFVGINQPDSNWYQSDFKDSTWLTGYKSIGYGDGDDSILIDTTVSLYIRKNITIDEQTVKNVKELVLYSDFDDGFIAYLNGVEILRVNMDENILHPGFLQTTTRSHEAENYRFFNSPYWKYKTVQGYYIDSTQLQKCHIGSTNFFAFEIHNDSIKGSDLSFCFDYNFINDSSKFIITSDKGRYYNTIAIDSTKLPVVVIETNEYGCDTSKVRAFMGIIDNGNSQFNKPTDKFNGYYGPINLSIRGNSTRWYPKRSYKIETIDSHGINYNVSLLGMPKENDWALLASFSDKSFLGNTLTFALGNKMGHYEPRSRYCELIVNGRNQGLYMLTELIKRDKNRVDIAKLEQEDNEGINLTGGYIFTNRGNAPWLDVIYPKVDDITSNQENYIKSYYRNAINVLKDKDFLDPETGYKKYFDVNSLVDYMIIEELCKNNDAYGESFYLYKDRDDIDGKVKYGPSWDYDNAYGFGIWRDTTIQNWKFDINRMTYIPRILQDTTVKRLFAERWHKCRKNILSFDSIYKMIDDEVLSIRNRIDVNFRIWPILGHNINPFESDPIPGFTYDDEIARLKDWIEKRFNWMDANIDKIYFKVTDAKSLDNQFSKNSVHAFPNPFSEKINVIIDIEKLGEINITLTDITGGNVVEQSQYFYSPGRFKMIIKIPVKIPPGFYLLNVYKDNIRVADEKFIKIN